MIAAATGLGSTFNLIPCSECSYLMKKARTQAEDKQYGLQMWSGSENIMDMRTADKGWASSFDFGRRANNSPLYKIIM